jgi:hypothetical protein
MHGRQDRLDRKLFCGLLGQAGCLNGKGAVSG